MKRAVLTKVLILLTFACSVHTSFSAPPSPSVDTEGDWDWIELDTGELLKGKIKTLYDNDLEFDSDHFGVITISWSDIKQLHSSTDHTLRLRREAAKERAQGDKPGKKDGVVTGKLAMRDEKVEVSGPRENVTLEQDDVLGIVTGRKEDLWSVRLSMGGNFRRGNTDLDEYHAQIRVERRTVATRLNLNYRGNFSQTNEVETSNNHRVYGFFDYFMTARVFLRPIGFEYYRDPFQNLAHRLTIGGSIGYTLVDRSNLVVDVSAGPALQFTEFETVEEGNSTSENLAGVAQAEVDWEIDSDLDFLGSYGLQFAPSDGGGLSLYFENTLIYELSGDIDLELSLIWDRTGNPVSTSEGEEPDEDDLRLILGVGVEF